MLDQSGAEEVLTGGEILTDLGRRELIFNDLVKGLYLFALTGSDTLKVNIFVALDNL